MAKSFKALVRDLRCWWSPSRARRAAVALGDRGDARAVEPLASALAGWFLTDPGLETTAQRVAAAVGALVRLGHARAALPVLPQALRSLDPEVRTAAGAAVEQVGGAEAIGAAVEALGDPALARASSVLMHENIRASEMLAGLLARLGRPAAVPLIRALRDRYEVGMGVWTREWLPTPGRSAARLAEEATAPAIIRSLARNSLDARRQVIDGWVSLGPTVVPSLLRLLQRPDRTTRLWAAEALGRLGECADAEERFRALLAGADEGARLAGAVGLGFLGDPAGLETLAGALHDEDAEGCAAAAEALGALGSLAGLALARLQGLAHQAAVPELRRVCHAAARAVEAGLRVLPAELEAASTPEGRGTELESETAAGGRCAARP